MATSSILTNVKHIKKLILGYPLKEKKAFIVYFKEKDKTKISAKEGEINAG